jgi:hypothetical protein
MALRSLREVDMPHSGIFFCLALLAIACSERNTLAITPSGAPDMKAGSWGGAQAELRVDDDQPARLELSCAHARIDRPLTISNDGSFEWKGRYFPERPGPSREDEKDEKNEGTDARIRGRVENDRVILNVIVDGKTVAGPVTLDFGKAARIIKCG